MPLTKKELDTIQNIIRKRFLGLTYEALGEKVLSSSEISELKRAGLLRPSVKHMMGDPYLLGKIIALLPPTTARTLSYKDVLTASKKMLPLTGVEKKAIDYATDHAGQYIRGIMNSVLKDTTALTARAGNAALRAVQEQTAGSIRSRETISELKTRLFDVIDDKTRDWQRVAHTEINTSIQNSIYKEIREKSDVGKDQLVYKLPAPDACKYCKKLYLQSDGVTPRIFRLKDLAESNIGLKAPDWQPTIDSVHPWCQCVLLVIPEEHDFVHERIVTEPFESDGIKYKRGQLIFGTEFENFSDEEKDKIGVAAILRNTGTTAKLTKKSLVNEMISESGLYCEHD